MRGIDTQVRKIRRAIFREVANMAYNSKNLAEDNKSDWQWECHFVQKMNQSLSVRV